MGDSQACIDAAAKQTISPRDEFDLSVLPRVYVLPAHLPIDEQHEAEDALSSRGAPLTYDVREANLVLANLLKARRAKLELLWSGVHLEDLPEPPNARESRSPLESNSDGHARKKRKLDDDKRAYKQSGSDATTLADDTGSETEDDKEPDSQGLSQLRVARSSTSSTEDSDEDRNNVEPSRPLIDFGTFAGRITVVKLEWLKESLKAGQLMDIEPYTVYTAKLVSPSRTVLRPVNPNVVTEAVKKAIPVAGAVSQADDNEIKGFRREHARRSGFGHNKMHGPVKKTSPKARPSHLLHQTTSEHDEAVSSSLPPMPDWVLKGKIYACERATPLKCPNDEFIFQLKKIKLARLLTLDEIGVRAYSTSIASLAAYPHPIQSTREILALPGCDQKIAHLFHEWQSMDGRIPEVADVEADPELTVLREFYEIWGVGAKTARDFYDKGWRDLDDIVEYGWNSLARVQQIGLKYYDEFLLRISRVEVESIAALIHKHAKLATDSQAEMVIVGGYRRGKPDCGDVDVILSHPNEGMTFDLINRVVKSLEKKSWITHTLTLNLSNTKRNQEPLPINTATQVGHGFDTLDKALVVWQNPEWSTKATDLAADPKAKNPNPHRRVDIIISPWRTVGCAVAGWTSGTTFQRDLRRYAKYVKGWKFDSSGVRERGTGRWVDLEGWTDPKTRCRDPQEAERRVFDGLGLVYREPWDRCTG